MVVVIFASHRAFVLLALAGGQASSLFASYEEVALGCRMPFIAVYGALNLHLPSPHRPVFLHPHLGVGGAPDLSAGIERGDPEEVVLRAVVDHGKRQSLAPVDDGHGKRRIELGEHGASDPVREGPATGSSP